MINKHLELCNNCYGLRKIRFKIVLHIVYRTPVTFCFYAF